jgi:pilus assembly protein CpaC
MEARRPIVAACIMALAVFGTSSSAEAQQDQTISLVVGQQRVLTIQNIQRVAIGDPGVADVNALPGRNQILITGVGQGRTSLLVWRTTGQRVSYLITVSAQDVRELVREVRTLLGDIEGVTIRTVGDRVYLDGQAYTTEDFNRIEQVAELYPQVRSFVTVAANAKRLVANTLNQELQRAGLKNVQATVVGTTIFLEGSVESPQDLQKAELITKAIGEDVENLLVVGIKRMILTEVQFVEIRKRGLDHVGIQWPFDITGGVDHQMQIQENLPGYPPVRAGLYQLNAQASSPFAFGMSMSDGYGRLLAQPQLVCASGEQAEFLAGGEVPIPLITANQLTIEYKEYGVKLEITPTADRHGNIQTEIFAEVSEVDDAVSVQIGDNINIPGFRSRYVRTNVTVRHGETIVLSGVFNHDQQKAVSKFPLLGHIPILGELWKSRRFQESKSELVIFVTPRIVNPDTERIRKTISDIKMRYQQARGQVTFSIFD